MRSMRKLALILSSVLCAICLTFGIVACGPNAAKEAIEMYLLPQDQQVVDADFTLPKTIGDGIEVTWKSSSEAIKIESGETEYTAKVTLQEDVTPVTLTIASGKHKKDFTVRVAKLDVYAFIDAYTFKQKNTAVSKGFDLDPSFTFQGKTATIEWSVDATSDSAAYIDLNTEKNHVNVHPDDDLVNVEIAAKFTYNGESATQVYPFSVSPILEHRQTVNRYYSVTGYPLELSGYIVHVVEASESYGNATFYMIDDDFCSGYYCYRVKIDAADVAKYVEGAHVTVSGDTTKNYNGLWENNSGGKAAIDDTAPIKLREHVYALDVDLIAGIPSMIWHESTLVSLTGWKVKSMAEKKPTKGTTGTLFTLTKDGAEIAVTYTKYASYASGVEEALINMYDTVKKDDIVNVTGILGNFNGFQIQPLTAADIQVVTTGEVEHPNGAKLKAAVEAVAAKVAENFKGCIIEDKNVTMPTAEGDVKISYRLAGGNEENPIKNPTVTIEGGEFQIKPIAKMKNYDIEVTYTIGEGEDAVKYYEFFKLQNQKMTAEEIVESVARSVRNKKTVVIDDMNDAGEQEIVYDSIYGLEQVSWAVKEDSKQPWLTVTAAGKITVDYLPMEETEITLVATIAFGDKSTTVERKFTVAAQPKTMFKMIDEAKEGTYKLAMNKNGTMLYFTGKMDGFYYATDTDMEKGVDVVLAGNATDGWTLKAGDKFLEIEYAEGTDGKMHTNVKIMDAQTAGKTWTWDATNKAFTWTVDVEGKATTYFLGTDASKSFTTISASTIDKISTSCVARLGSMAEATDEGWANELLGTLNLDKTTFTEAGTETLPTTKKYNSTVVWTLKEPSTSFSVANNELTITLPESDDVTATLHVVVTVGEATAEKDVEITAKAPVTITNDGSADHPYTPTEAIAFTSKLASDGWSESAVYVKGYVASIKNYPSESYPNWNNVVLVDEKGGDAGDGFLVYRIYPNADTALKLWGDLSVGSQITVKGLVQNYKGKTPEMNDKDNTKVETVFYEDARSAVEKAQAAVDGVKFESTNLTDNIELPKSTVTGVTFAWVSDNNQAATVDSNTNKLNVTRGDADQNVKLTLTATCGTETATEDYDLVVKQKVTLAPGEQSITLDFTTNFSTYTDSDDWKFNNKYGAYGAHSLSFATLGGGATIEGTVELNNASRQIGTITTMPILAAKNNLTAYVTVHADGVSIQSLTFKLKEWSGKKKFSKIVIETSTNGSTWTEYGKAVGDGTSNTILISEHGTFTFTATDDSVTYVRLAIYATGSDNVQVGISSIEMTVKPLAAAAALAAPVAILPGKQF